MQQHAAIVTTIKKRIYKSDRDTIQNFKIKVLILGCYTLVCSIFHECSFQLFLQFPHIFHEIGIQNTIFLEVEVK